MVLGYTFCASGTESVGIFKKIQSIFGSGPAEPVSEKIVLTQAQVERRVRVRLNPLPGTRVLIVDDSKTVVVALAKTLRSVDCVTLEALDGEKGVELARAIRPDLIFLDIVLPGMDGFAALRHLRRDPVTSHIPVVMISGNEQAAQQFYANRIGADGFMKKPFSRLEVFKQIEVLLDADSVPRRVHDDAGPVPTRSSTR